MDTDESILPIKTASRIIRLSANPLVRDKGYGTPVGRPRDSAGWNAGSDTRPTVRLGKTLLLSAEPYKKARTGLLAEAAAGKFAYPGLGGDRGKALALVPKAVTYGELKEELMKEEEKANLYEERKGEADPMRYADAVFFHKDYVADYEANLKPKPERAREAYKQRVEAIAKRASEFPRDMVAYPPGTILRPIKSIRHKNALSGPRKCPNEHIDYD